MRDRARTTPGTGPAKALLNCLNKTQARQERRPSADGVEGVELLEKSSAAILG